MDKKQTIDIERAEEMLFQLLSNVSFGDNIYELAQGIFHRCVAEIENKYNVDDEELDSSAAWYDEIEEDFFQEVYNKTLDSSSTRNKTRITISKTKFFVGQHVKWNDPEVNDYEPQDRAWILNRTFEIDELDEDGDMASISEVDGYSTAEVWTSELVPA